MRKLWQTSKVKTAGIKSIKSHVQKKECGSLNADISLHGKREAAPKLSTY